MSSILYRKIDVFFFLQIDFNAIELTSLKSVWFTRKKYLCMLVVDWTVNCRNGVTIFRSILFFLIFNSFGIKGSLTDAEQCSFIFFEVVQKYEKYLTMCWCSVWFGFFLLRSLDIHNFLNFCFHRILIFVTIWSESKTQFYCFFSYLSYYTSI